jgi:hypothetical protein
MGLSVQVGLLAGLLDSDPEGAEWFKEELARINRLLGDNGLPLHMEPRELPQLASRSALDSYPYSFLHYLRRVAARRLEDPDWEATPLPEGEDPSEDPAIDEELGLMRSHLICHSDAEGYYVPIDFDEVLFDDSEEIAGGGLVGSSQRLLAELQAVAPALGIALEEGRLTDEEAERISEEVHEEGELWIEKGVWLDLFEAARLSLQHGSVIVFA